jgi:hypothetical protein
VARFEIGPHRKSRSRVGPRGAGRPIGISAGLHGAEEVATATGYGEQGRNVIGAQFPIPSSTSAQMQYPSHAFDAETVAIMGRVCDEAWGEAQSRLSLRQAGGSLAVLSSRV